MVNRIRWDKINIPRLIYAVAVCLFLLVSCRNNEGNSAVGSSGESFPRVDEAEAAYVEVRVLPVVIGDLIIKLKSPGEAVTNKLIVMKPEVSGRIKVLNVREGAHVQQGEVLAELDDSEYALNLESAEASRLKNLSELLLESQFSTQTKVESKADKTLLSQAEKTFEGQRKLYREGQISEQEFEKVSNAYELFLIESGQKKDEITAAAKGLTQSEIEVKKARLNLEKTRIRAPFSGIITDINVSLEEHVSTATELFTLVNLEDIQVQAKVLESEIGKMKLGREVVLKFSAYPERMFQGMVKAISPLISPEEKTCKVFIDAPNPREEIKPGMHAEVEIVADIYPGRILVPQEAILHRGGRKLVFIYEDGLAKRRYIQTGLENEEFAEILPAERQGEGVAAGELVLVEGHFTLAHDEHVKIVEY